MAEATSTPILRTLGRCLWSPRGSSSKHLGQSHPSVPVTANSRTVRNHSFSSLAAVQRTFKKLPVPSEARPRTLHRCWKDGLQFTFALFTATAPVVRSDLAAWPGRTVGAGHPPRQLLAFPPFVSGSLPQLETCPSAPCVGCAEVRSGLPLALDRTPGRLCSSLAP